MKSTIARWESRTRKHYVTVWQDGNIYGFESPGHFGCLGRLASTEEAITLIAARVDRGDFLPDAAKTAMSRVL